MLNELDWTTMTHNGGKVPRLVCVQAEFVDGWYPIYRHPVDAPAPPTHELSTSVRLLKASLESATNQKFNHVLIQQYRSGEDCISQHADKTLDLVPGSKIVNVSLGAMRYMSLKKKRDSLRARSASSSTLPKRKINFHPKNAISRPPAPNQRIALEHNSIFVLGAHTNKLWTHQIKPDKRSRAQKSPAELAFDGFRVSLTFRSVATFVTNSSGGGGGGGGGGNSSSGRPQLIYGRGATAKDRVHASPVLYSDSASESERENARAQAKKLLGAFAAENRLGESFDWQRAYGQGFDIVDFPTDL
ncbi:hypothetical protein BZA70DRAFT_240917 [Myxozyma melibiosi]|uniref:Fe2OG dioxygenase domain-containing protein n=1 Tax=Myxozyma melibiosi TaxID=54550 RepID=A0ABR1F0W1_9ASCO